MTLHITLVLDETGSMHSIKDEAISGFNAYVAEMAKEHPKAKFTAVFFDSAKIHCPWINVPLKDVKPLTEEMYTPGAMTPLIDAVYQAIVDTAARVKKKDKAAVAVLTDGHENASHKHTFEALSGLIKEKTEAGWDFSFLGAGIDAFDQGQKMGFAVNKTMTVGRGKMRETFSVMAASTSRYASGADASYTDAERKKTA